MVSNESCDTALLGYFYKVVVNKSRNILTRFSLIQKKVFELEGLRSFNVVY